MNYFPATAFFIEDVDALHIRGVELDPDMGRPTSYGIERLRIRSKRALDGVGRRLKGKYVIVPLSIEEWNHALRGVREARKTIREARTGAPLR
jgi:hypothetical protein